MKVFKWFDVLRSDLELRFGSRVVIELKSCTGTIFRWLRVPHPVQESQIVSQCLDLSPPSQDRHSRPGSGGVHRCPYFWTECLLSHKFPVSFRGARTLEPVHSNWHYGSRRWMAQSCFVPVPSSVVSYRHRDFTLGFPSLPQLG